MFLLRLARRPVMTAVLVLTAVVASTAVAVFVASQGRPAEAASGPVLVGAGDIAVCGRDEATAALLDGIPGTAFTTGDNAYESGTAAQFAECYDPGWGRHKDRTRPAPGNHDYHTAGASGYFGYFGEAAGDPSRGYYSYDLGAWHVVALNSACDQVGGCGSDSPMVSWLKRDLAANPARCTLAYWHHPLFTSGEHGNDTRMRTLWTTLYRADADVVVNGHDHDYERFAPQTPGGKLDRSRGLREFVVGTGGRELRPFDGIRPNSQARSANAFGVLKLTLGARAYDWKFVPVAGETFTDSGTGRCH